MKELEKKQLKLQNRLYRHLAYEYLGGKCRLCGSTKNLVIHHKNGDWRNNSKENLALLCQSCHVFLHKNQKTKKLRKGSSSDKVTIIIPKILAKQIDKVISYYRMHRSRPDFVIDAVKRRIDEIEKIRKQ